MTSSPLAPGAREGEGVGFGPRASFSLGPHADRIGISNHALVAVDDGYDAGSAGLRSHRHARLRAGPGCGVNAESLPAPRKVDDASSAHSSPREARCHAGLESSLSSLKCRLWGLLLSLTGLPASPRTPQLFSRPGSVRILSTTLVGARAATLSTKTSDSTAARNTSHVLGIHRSTCHPIRMRPVERSSSAMDGCHRKRCGIDTRPAETTKTRQPKNREQIF